MTKLLDLFLSNVFDIIPPPSFISQFIKDGKLNLDLVLSHHLMNHNLAFCFIWHQIYKTFPTKMDFIRHLKLTNTNITTRVTLNEDFVRKTLQHLPHSRFALTYEGPEPFLTFAKTAHEVEIKRKWLYEKWMYRFQVPSVSKDPNIFLQFSYICNNYKSPDIQFITPNIPIQPDLPSDIRHINEYEQLQTMLYQDYYFFIKAANQAAIYVDTDKITATELIRIKSIISKKLDCYVITFNAKDKTDDPGLDYTVIPSVQHVLPSIFKCFILITDQRFPCIKGLSYQNNIMYQWNRTTPTQKASFEYANQYHKFLVRHWAMLEYYPDAHLLIDDFAENAISEVPECIQNSDDPLPYVLKGAIPIGKDILSKCLGLSELPNDISDSDKGILFNTIRNNTKTLKILTESWETLFGYYVAKPKDSVLHYINFIPRYFCRIASYITSYIANKSSPYKVVLIDNRASYMSIISILFTLYNLNNSWDCIVYTSEEAASFYKEKIGWFADVRVWEPLNAKKFHIDIYSDILKSANFWADIGGEKCLIIQDDGVLLRKGIERFMDYDYIGAPWADAEENRYIKEKVNPELVGNGGLSLRTIAKQLEVCQKFEKEKRWLFFNNLVRIPEDVWSVYGMHRIDARMPTYKEAAEFATEEVFNIRSLGFHKFYTYNNPDNVRSYFDKILQEVS